MGLTAACADVLTPSRCGLPSQSRSRGRAGRYGSRTATLALQPLQNILADASWLSQKMRGTTAQDQEGRESKTGLAASDPEGGQTDTDSSEDSGSVGTSAAESDSTLGEPASHLNELLESGKLRRRDALALETELANLDDSLLASSFAAARRRNRFPEGRSPHMHPPRNLYWSAKKKTKLQPGACITDVANVPALGLDRWQAQGFELLRTSKVATILLCGGTHSQNVQSLLTTDLGLPSGKSLLHIFSERLLRLRHLADRHRSTVPKDRLWASASCLQSQVPLYLLTNDENRTCIEEHFQDHGFFGLDPSDVHFLMQPLEPMLDQEGRVLLEDRWRIARRPGGNGAIFDALRQSRMLDNLRKRNITHIFIMSCNNLLGRIADPRLLGYVAALDAPCGLKVAQRTHVDDALGIFCNHFEHGDQSAPKACVIEPYEIHAEHRHRKARDGKVKLRTGNLSQYVFSMGFLLRVANSPKPPLHAIRTTCRVFNPDTMDYEDEQVNKYNAFRLESFIFDSFCFLESVPGLLVDRTIEFSTVTHGHHGELFTETAVTGLSLLHQKWILAAGGSFKDGAVCGNTRLCELSPLVSYTGEGLQGSFHGELDLPFHLEAHGVPLTNKDVYENGHVHEQSGQRAHNKLSGQGTPFKRLTHACDGAVAEICSDGEKLPPTPPEDEVSQEIVDVAAPSSSSHSRVHKPGSSEGEMRGMLHMNAASAAHEVEPLSHSSTTQDPAAAIEEPNRDETGEISKSDAESCKDSWSGRKQSRRKRSELNPDSSARGERYHDSARRQHRAGTCQSEVVKRSRGKSSPSSSSLSGPPGAGVLAWMEEDLPTLPAVSLQET